MHKKQQNFIQTYIEINGITVGMKIYIEKRNNTRASLNKNGIIIRVPIHLTKEKILLEIEKMKNWAKEKYSEKEEKFVPIEVKDGKIIYLADLPYTIKVEIGKYKTYRGNIKENTLNLFLPIENDPNRNEQILLKTIGLVFHRYLIERVAIINKNTINKDYNRIETKNMTSKWGSCSSRKVLTFSNQLFLQPKWIIDYVIVHELCHLIEMNHSDRFWNLVATHFPKYKEAKFYLKKGEC